MFNIRNILNRRNDQSRSPESLLPRTPEEGVDSNASSAEGFLCPHCFLAFPTADLLQNHYESCHSDGINDVSGDGRELFNCPACKMKLGSEIELKSHYERHHSDKKEEFEIEVMALQVKALEEGKSLLQSELEAVRFQSSELMKENIKIREERDGLELKAAKLAGELADLKAATDELKTQKVSAESAVKLSEERINKLEVEIQQRPEADDVTLLQKELVSVQKMMDQLTLQKEAEKDTLQKQCSNIQDTCLRLQAEKIEFENILKSCPKKEEIESLQAKICEMSVVISQLQRDLDVKEVEKYKLQASLEKYGNYEDIKSLLVQKQNSVEEMLRRLTEKDELISKLESELKTVKESVEEMKIGREKLFSKIEEGEGASVAILQLKEENAQLQEKFLHQQMLYGEIAHKTESKMEELHTLLKKANSELLASNEKCGELETYLAQSQKQLQELRTQKDGIIEELNLKIANLTASSAADKAHIHRIEEGIENKSGEFAEMKISFEKLQDEFKNKKVSKFYVPEICFSRYEMECEEKYSSSKTLENLKQDKSSLEYKLADCNKALSVIQTNLMDKGKKLAETEENLAQTVQDLKIEKDSKSKLETEFKELKKINEETKLQLVNKNKLLTEYEDSKVEFCNKISSLNEELSESHLKESDLSTALENMNEEKSKISEKCLSLEEKNKSLTLSITSLQNEKNSLLSELEEVKKAVSDLTEVCSVHEKEMKELAESYQKEKNNSERVSRDYELAKELYSKEKLKMQKQIENLENDCAKQLAQIQETVKALESQLEEVEERNATANSALEETKEILKQKELEWEAKEAHHIAQVEVLTENIKTLREDLSSEQKRRGNVEQKLEEISGTKLELEAKLENALDERKELLERCLKSETECERLQKSTTEMRRKYEDCVAALQELGRENQTLQVENMKHITRKWADDAEVTYCTACGKLFTVTIRKHHCRNCGNIFCNECSAKTATVASSKKPVRVCDVCYGEVTK